MSATLAFRPVVPPEYQDLSYELKKIFETKYDLHNGPKILTDSDVPYLEGLVDAGIKDAQLLIDNIQQFDKVEIFFVY